MNRLHQMTAAHVERFQAKIKKTDGCWLWTGKPGSHGYGLLAVDRYPVFAHRIAYFLHHGEDPGALCVCHRCDVRLCVNHAHLFLGTKAENNVDMRAKGRGGHGVVRGSASPVAKLTEGAVAEIRNTYRHDRRGDGMRVVRRFGISPSQASRILRGAAWPHV